MNDWEGCWASADVAVSGKRLRNQSLYRTGAGGTGCKVYEQGQLIVRSRRGRHLVLFRE